MFFSRFSLHRVLSATHRSMCGLCGSHSSCVVLRLGILSFFLDSSLATSKMLIMSSLVATAMRLESRGFHANAVMV